MRQVAVRALANDRSKAVSAVAGVAFAMMLVLAETGLYGGFVEDSRALVRHVGGDVWVMARGTQVVDYGEPLSPASGALVAGHPCVERVRPVVFGWGFVRKPSGAVDNLQIVGYEPEPGAGPLVPWSLREGLPGDLRGPMRITVDAHDIGRLELPRRPIGAPLLVFSASGAEGVAHVAAVTHHIRSFTLQPYAFADLGTARRLIGMGAGAVTYLAVDLRHPACADDVMDLAHTHPDLQATTAESFARMSSAYWVDGSGAGAALGFSALLGFIVGMVIVGQTLHSLAQEHQRELATLKAMGASGREMSAFVLWQAGLLACLGGTVGVLLVVALRRLVDGELNIALSPAIFLSSVTAIVAMCALASLWSVRRVLALEAVEVFR